MEDVMERNDGNWGRFVKSNSRGVGEDEEQQMLADAGTVIENNGLGHNKRLLGNVYDGCR